MAIQGDLDAKLAELARIQEDLRQERIRLARLRARLAEARVALADRLVQLYKADKPDVVTVVLESDGFADLLERTEFMQRVSDQDARIIDRVRTRAPRPSARRRGSTRSSSARPRWPRRSSAPRRRRPRQGPARRPPRLLRPRALREVDRARQHAPDRQDLEGDLAALERENAKIQAQLAGAQNGSSTGAAGPIRPGSGGLIWPVNGPVVSPFGMRWGRLHAGVDIAVPSGTPVRAAKSGNVLIAGWVGGYGNYTCIGHGGGLSTCYGHQSSIGTSVGANVSQGQVIGSSGCTGHCFGPHVHFETRINGAPVNPMGYL